MNFTRRVYVDNLQHESKTHAAALTSQQISDRSRCFQQIGSAEGHMVRSRAQYIDQGERPTKYFCAFEKHSYVSKIICSLELEDGTKITKQEEILKEDREPDEYMKYNKMTKFSNEKVDDIEGILTYKEISTALYQMQSDKSPGISGFTVDFF